MRASVAVLAIAIIACRPTFTAPPPATTTPLDFGGTFAVSGAQSAGPVTYSVGIGQITANGIYPYPSLCDRHLAFNAYLSHGWIALQVQDTTSYANATHCGLTANYWGWQMVVALLPPGTYVMDVQYPDGSGMLTSVQQDTVVVP